MAPMTRRRLRLDELTTDAKAGAAGTMDVGWIVAGSSAAAPLIDFVGNTLGPLPARTTVVLDAELLELAVRSQQGVVLQFERGRLDLPIITGFIQPKESPLLDQLLGAPRVAKAAPAPQKAPSTSTSAHVHAQTTQSKGVEARLDGKRVVLEAEQEIVLRCGDASITLTRDGKILVRGAYVETHSRGVNRIKGGAVKIN